jgi:hypothetical protein
VVEAPGFVRISSFLPRTGAEIDGIAVRGVDELAFSVLTVLPIKYPRAVKLSTLGLDPVDRIMPGFLMARTSEDQVPWTITAQQSAVMYQSGRL